MKNMEDTSFTRHDEETEALLGSTSKRIMIEENIPSSAARPRVYDTFHKRPRVDLRCRTCGRSFTERRSLVRHRRQTSCAGLPARNFRCRLCQKAFTRDELRRRHENEKHHGIKRNAVSNANAVTPRLEIPTRSSQLERNGDPSVRADDGTIIDSLSGPFVGPSDTRDRAVAGQVDPFILPVQQPPDAKATATSQDFMAADSDFNPLLSSKRRDSGKHLPVESAMNITGLLSDTIDVPTIGGLDEAHADAIVDQPMLDDSMDAESMTADDPHATLFDPWFSTMSVGALDFLNDSWMQQHFPGGVDDTMSISSRSSIGSIRSMLDRMRSKRPKSQTNINARTDIRKMLLQRCGHCKLPFEKDEGVLRTHLEAHLEKLRSQAHWPKCDVCQISFASREDFNHHITMSASPRCCALPVTHKGSCEGHACGLAFKHAEICSGHHPPTDTSTQWTDHDRMRYGQLLLAQLQLSALQLHARDAAQLRKLRERISNESLPVRLAWRRSISSLVPSVFSWRSQPFMQSYDMEQLTLDMQRSRVASRPSPRSTALDSALEAAASVGDQPQCHSLVKRGADWANAISIAFEQRHANSMTLLLGIVAAGDARIRSGTVDLLLQRTLSGPHTIDSSDDVVRLGWNAPMVAARLGLSGTLAQVFASGGQMTSSKGWNVLLRLAIVGGSPACVEEVLSYADIDTFESTAIPLALSLSSMSQTLGPLLEHCREKHSPECSHRRDIFMQACKMREYPVLSVAIDYWTHEDLQALLAIHPDDYSIPSALSLVTKLINRHGADGLHKSTPSDPDKIQEVVGLVEEIPASFMLHTTMGLNEPEISDALKSLLRLVPDASTRLEPKAFTHSQPAIYGRRTAAQRVGQATTPMQRTSDTPDPRCVQLLLFAGAGPSQKILNMLFVGHESSSSFFREMATQLLIERGLEFDRRGCGWEHNLQSGEGVIHRIWLTCTEAVMIVIISLQQTCFQRAVSGQAGWTLVNGLVAVGGHTTANIQ